MAVMKVYAGPPGTGKTWTAARQAVEVLRPGTSPEKVQQVHEELLQEGRIIWVTFHPSYSYEDFVEGFRPEETPDGNLIYSIMPGPFLRACRAASDPVSANRFQVGQIIRTRAGTEYRVTHVEAGGLVLATVRNVRKDAVAGEEDEPAQGYVDFWSIDRFAAQGRDVRDLRVPGKDNERKQQIARETGLPTTFFANSSRHAAVYETLQEAGRVVEPVDVVLVIDEINRADLSRVFGELITLLEFDKRQGAAEERQVALTYSGRPLSVPATLSIIGTMNTADKSLSTVDLALRRRFEFILVPPDPDLTPPSYGGVNVRELFSTMNRRLTALGHGENLVGHADYMEEKLNELRCREGFEINNNGRLRALAHTLLNKTVPYLADLFRGDMTVVRFVISPGLFIEDSHEDLAAELQEIGRLDVAPSIQPADWWSPSHPAWDSERFRAVLPVAEPGD